MSDSAQEIEAATKRAVKTMDDYVAMVEAARQMERQAIADLFEANRQHNEDMVKMFRTANWQRSFSSGLAYGVGLIVAYAALGWTIQLGVMIVSGK